MTRRFLATVRVVPLLVGRALLGAREDEIWPTFNPRASAYAFGVDIFGDVVVEVSKRLVVVHVPFSSTSSSTTRSSMLSTKSSTQTNGDFDLS